MTLDFVLTKTIVLYLHLDDNNLGGVCKHGMFLRD